MPHSQINQGVDEGPPQHHKPEKLIILQRSLTLIHIWSYEGSVLPTALLWPQHVIHVAHKRLLRHIRKDI